MRSEYKMRNFKYTGEVKETEFGPMYRCEWESIMTNGAWRHNKGWTFDAPATVKDEAK